MKITVTQEDIDKGKRSDVCGCPIALAFRRAGGDGARSVRVDGHHLYLGSDPGRNIAKLPPDARVFVVDFDDGRPVSPFEFEVDL